MYDIHDLHRRMRSEAARRLKKHRCPDAGRILGSVKKSRSKHHPVKSWWDYVKEWFRDLFTW